MERNRNYDLLRVVGMLFVILYHVHEKPFTGTPVLFHALMVLLASGNGLFFMLSGRFHLEQCFDQPADYRIYYRKKAIGIVLPYVSMSLVFTGWTMLQSGGIATFSVGPYLRNALLDLSFRNASTHLWFMYVLIGILTILPFLAKLFQNLRDWELKLFAGLCLGWNFISTYLIQDGVLYRLLGGNLQEFEAGFAYDAFLLSDWIDAFLFGYLMHRLYRKEKRVWIYGLGIAGFLMEVCGRTLFGDYYRNWDNFAPAYLVFFPMVYAFFIYQVHVRDNAFGKLITFLSKHSYMVYLVHWYVNIYIYEHHWIASGHRFFDFLLTGALTFALSFGMAFVLNELVFFPLERYLKRRLLGEQRRERNE